MKIASAVVAMTLLIRTDLRDTDLFQSNFYNASLQASNFENANLVESNLQGTDLKHAIFTNNKVDRTTFMFATNLNKAIGMRDAKNTDTARFK